MGSLGSAKDWASVFFLAVTWGVFTYIFSRYRLGAGLGASSLSLFGGETKVSLRTPPRSQIGSIVVLAFMSFDLGFVETFGKRSLHDGLLLILLAANLAYVATLFGFRLLLPADRAVTRNDPESTIR